MIALFNYFCALSSTDHRHRNQKLQFPPLRHRLPHQVPSPLHLTTFAPSMNCPVVPKADLCWKRRQHRLSAMAVSSCDRTSKPDVSNIETAIAKCCSDKCSRSPIQPKEDSDHRRQIAHCVRN
jgi:hypothetical protein